MKIRILLAAIIFGIGFGTVFVSAQPVRRKAKPLATPLPVMTGAQIISRAEELLIESPLSQPIEKPLDSDAPTAVTPTVQQLADRMKRLEAGRKVSYDDKQKRLLLNLDILTRAEQRSESLRKQLFEMIEKESTLKTRLEQIELDIRPEMIERSLQLAGSMKPEEIRDLRRKRLEVERANLNVLIVDIQSTRGNLSTNLQRSELMVEKLRSKLEKDIDDSLLADEEDPADPLRL